MMSSAFVGAPLFSPALYSLNARWYWSNFSSQLAIAHVDKLQSDQTASFAKAALMRFPSNK